MESDRAERLAAQDILLGGPDDTRAPCYLETERPNMEIYDGLRARIISIASSGGEDNVMDRVKNPHQVSFSVIFPESAHAMEAQLTTDWTGPTPSSDYVSAMWSYENQQSNRKQLVKEEANKASAKDEGNRRARNTLLYIEESITDIESKLREGKGILGSVVVLI